MTDVHGVGGPLNAKRSGSDPILALSGRTEKNYKKLSGQLAPDKIQRKFLFCARTKFTP
jgi:hypothetical protein